MRILVLQHTVQEDLGIFGKFLRQDGAHVTCIQMTEEHPVIDLDKFDALWVLGGAVQVWQTSEHPWLKAELGLIREAVVHRRMPYFGICLGHQFLAQALGGTVGKMRLQEVGLHPVIQLEGAVGLRGLPWKFPCFQWHGAEVTLAPRESFVNARSDACAIQGLEWNNSALSVQFHPEIDRSVLRNWFKGEGCVEALADTLGHGSAEKVLQDLAEAENELHHMARTIYDNWVTGFFQ